MADLVTDLRHALRMFRKSPAFTLAAVAALGIGANTAIFSVVSAVVLRPLSLPDPDTLVALQTRFPSGFAGAAGSPIKFRHWRTQTATIVDATAYLSNVVNYAGGGVPERSTLRLESERRATGPTWRRTPTRRSRRTDCQRGLLPAA